MNARFKPYPAYKDSGVEWLGRIPEHWMSMPFKNLFRLIYRYPTYYDIEYVPSGVLEVRGEALTKDGRIARLEDERYISNETCAQFPRTILELGDIVMSVRGTMGKIGLVEESCVGGNITANLLRLSPKRDTTCGPFLRWLLQGDYFAQSLDRCAPQTTIKTVTIPQLSQICLPVPQLAEQHVIASFLDRETEKIDALVKKKERLVELLQEKRTALISHAVTQGLNPNVPQKDSGIPWLGKIPQHWQLKKLGQVANIVRGGSPRPAGDPRFFDGDACPWITVAEVTKDDGKFLNQTETCLTEEGRRHSRFLHAGTLVMTNSGATLGVPKILNISGCINDGSVAFLDLNASVVKDCLYYYLASLTKNLRDRIKQGSGQPNLNTSIFRSLWYPVGSQEEQERIVAYLDDETAKLEALVAKVQMAIERLQEYRTALISAAVTGQIDVRGASS